MRRTYLNHGTLTDMPTYDEHDDEITIDTVEIDGDEVIIITIERAKIEDWYHEGLDRAVIHIESEPSNPKFL